MARTKGKGREQQGAKRGAAGQEADGKQPAKRSRKQAKQQNADPQPGGEEKSGTEEAHKGVEGPSAGRQAARTHQGGSSPQEDQPAAGAQPKAASKAHGKQGGAAKAAKPSSNKAKGEAKAAGKSKAATSTHAQQDGKAEAQHETQQGASGSAAGASKQGGGSKAKPPANNAPITVNRAPVLTLWVATVAQRQGHSRDAALTFGQEVAGILAHSKGKRLGIYEESDEEAKEAKEEREREAGVQRADVFGMRLKAVEADGELRAADRDGGKAVNPKRVAAYLHRAFGDRLEDAEAAMRQLAEALPAEEAGRQGYALYERFRPSVPAGERGWGAKGQLDLALLASLAAQQREQ